MRRTTKFYLGTALVIAAAWVGTAAAELEPWSQIEGRSKFLRTKHHIEVVRIKSAVYRKSEAGLPFPVHVMIPNDYDKDVNRRYGVVYMLGGKSGWDNGPEKGGALYWSVWCKTPLVLDHLQAGRVTKADFKDNIKEDELDMFNRWLAESPYEDLIVVSLWNPGGSNTTRYEKYLLGEVIPYVDAHFRTIPDRRFRGIDGACAGAAQALMISARRPQYFGFAGGQQTDLGSYPGTRAVVMRNLSRIHKAGGIAYNINTNVRDGCNSYSNRGRLFRLVTDLKNQGFPVTVNVFKSCPHGYCAYRYPNGHQALYWFSQQFKRNALRLGINQGLPKRQVASANEPEMTEADGVKAEAARAGKQRRPLTGLW